MRTRFINTDYFSTETLGSFLKLPIPILPPPPPLLCFTPEEELLRSEPLPCSFNEICRFPIDDVLRKFLSQVIPQRVDHEHAFGSPTDAAAASFPEEENNVAEPLDRLHESKVPRFEEPEVLEDLDSICLPVECNEWISGAPPIQQNSDLPMPDLKMNCLEEIQESVCLVKRDGPDYCANENDPRSDFNDGLVPEHAAFSSISFPFLEVDEISLKSFTNLSLEDELLSFFKDVDTLWSQDDSLVVQGCAIIGSAEYDVFDIVSNHCQTKDCEGSDVADVLLAIEPISMVDGLMSLVNSEDRHLDVNYFIFEEPELLDTGSSQLCDAYLEDVSAEELEACFWVFGEDERSSTFNRMVVSKELALADDVFTSLPVPLISDDHRIMSMEAIFNDTMAVLKPLRFSASDEIYLDWHLIEEEPCNQKIFSPFQNLLEELNSSANNFECESFVHDISLIEILISGDAITGPEKEQYLDLPSILSENTSNNTASASRNSESGGCQRRGNHEPLAEGNARKASLLFKSMTQLDDLEYFLNPGGASNCPGKDKDVTVKTSHKAMNSKEGAPQITPYLDEDVDGSKTEQLQTHTSIVSNNTSSETADEVQSLCMPMLAHDGCHTLQTENSYGLKPSFPGSVIIVNTQNSDKETIVSRRSTYQKVLAMEKEGLQVVERDLDLPVDIILSPAICLLWYDQKNIGKKVTTMDEASSSLSMCMETIATDILTSLSVCFSGCILVFEGEFGFITTVMECSDSLYAAAASLGIELQLFHSYSTELTNNIITSSISSVARMFKDVYPKMPESETLAESFLTKFPSINSLTAHAILSSEVLLFEFLGCSSERKLHTVQKYHVPQESIALFCVLCKYGERDDSKSNMTECSSSVSSGPASDKYQFNAEHERKRRRCIPDSPETKFFVDGKCNYELLNLNDDKIEGGPSMVVHGQDSWKLMDSAILDEMKPPSSSLGGCLDKSDRCNYAWMTDPHHVPDELPHGVRNSPVFQDDKVLARNHKLEISFDDELNWFNPSKPEKMQGDHIDEVLDLNDRHSFDTDVPSIENCTDFSAWLPEIEQSSRRKSRAIRKLSFSENLAPSFPTAAELNSQTDFWIPVRDKRQRLQEISDFPEEVAVPQRDQTKFPEDAFRLQMPQYGLTPLSKAINSEHPQPGSPWTIEFLNRVREKSRLHKQSLPNLKSTPSFGYTGNVNRIMKRRSPSIIEFFKYQGGATPTKPREQKQVGQPPSSCKNASGSTTEGHIWTPFDKRAKQTLGFTRNGNGSQTRLVWSDGSAHRLPKKLRPSI